MLCSLIVSGWSRFALLIMFYRKKRIYRCHNYQIWITWIVNLCFVEFPLRKAKNQKVKNQHLNLDSFVMGRNVFFFFFLLLLNHFVDFTLYFYVSTHYHSHGSTSNNINILKLELTDLIISLIRNGLGICEL